MIEMTDMTREERAAFALRALFRTYGYTPYTMSKFEEYDLYVRNKNFLVSDHVITFTDHTGRLLALKPDVTLSIVKNTRDTPSGVAKVYYDENVYRVARGESAFREIRQTGLECIGEIDAYALCEVLMLAARSLSTLAKDAVLEVSHLDIVSGVLDALGVDDTTRAQLLRLIAEKNLHEITALCADTGADPAAAEALRRLISTYGRASDVIPVLHELSKTIPTIIPAVEQLDTVLCTLTGMGCQTKVRIDFSLINDMGYYNGLVFRGFVKGIAEGVLAGGRYDRLMQRMGRHSHAIGFAVYLDQLEQLPDADESEYDVDTVLLYGESDEPAAIGAAAARLIAQGTQLRVARQLPEHVRVRRVIRLGEEDKQ